jgi:hypothetical protein
MSKYYAIVDQSNQVSGIIQADNKPAGIAVQIPSLDANYLNKVWNGSQLVDQPEETLKCNLFEFREKFTTDEKTALYTAANTDIQIKIWLDDLAALQTSGGLISLDDPRTILGVNYLESSGILATGRAAEILGT